MLLLKTLILSLRFTNRPFRPMEELLTRRFQGSYRLADNNRLAKLLFSSQTANKTANFFRQPSLVVTHWRQPLRQRRPKRKCAGKSPALRANILPFPTNFAKNISRFPTKKPKNISLFPTNSLVLQRKPTTYGIFNHKIAN